MRKLFVVPLLLFLAIVPAAVAATSAPAIDLAESVDLTAGDARSDVFKQARIERRRAEARERRARARKRRAQAAAAARAVPPQLQAIAACESGGNPRAISSDGTYRGKYQFSVATWQGVGGQGDPAAASEAEQDKRAAMLYARSGPGQWPVCGS
jgi:hypothetical protein